ncbi:serine hydrolase [Emticicia sp. 17c]|uniref:serine hydrolase n=1 Tax=Emticicia sp. 17c TaxID=3127704 RepID=UPI00301BAF9A
MKKILLLLLLPLAVLGQSNQQKIDSVRVLLEKAFNENDGTKIYTLTGESFRKEISEMELKHVIGMLYSQLGKWKTSEFKQITNGTALYKGIFEKSNQNIFLSLDTQNKISGLLFQPYTADKPHKDYQVASDNPMQSPLDLKVDSLARLYIQLKNTVGIAIAVVQDGETFTYNYGETRQGNHQLPNADKTLFEIGSISKTFTSILLADEVANGRMSLEDPINKYLPDSIPPMAYKDRPITLKTLANHTSGFPRLPFNLYKKGDPADNPYKNYDLQRMYTYLRNFKPYREVGLTYDYSNFAVGLLGNILAQQHQTTYQNLLNEKICKPLMLSNTFIDIPANRTADFAQGYNEKGEAVAAWDLNTLAGAGGIRSTVTDLVRYLQANMTEAPETLQQAIDLSHQITFDKGKDVVALGWNLLRRKAFTIYHHSGGTGGFRTFVGFDKEHQTAVVVLANSAEEVSAIGFDLLF